MELNIIDKGNCLQELQVNLNNEELNDYFERAYKEYSKNYRVDGFRKGKAPLHIIKLKYGEQIRELAITDFIPQEVFNEYIEANKINVIGTSKLIDVEKKENEGLSFKIEYEFMPQIEVKNYKDIEVTRENYIVDDKTVDEEFENLMLKYSTKAMDAKVLDDKYIVTIDLQALDNTGAVLIGESAKDIELYVGDKRLNENLYTAIKDIKEGEEKIVELPMSKSEETSSVKDRQMQSYKLTCKKVEKIIYPEINEEFLKKLTNREDIKSEDDFKNYLKEQIQSYYDNISQENLEFSLIQEIVKLNDVKIPDTYVNNVLDSKYEEYVKHIGEHHQDQAIKPKEEFIKENRPDTIFNLKWFLISEKIIQQENLTVTDEDLKKLAEKEVKRIPIAVEKLLELYKKDKKAESRALDNKLMNFLIENAKITIKERPLRTEEKENKIIT